MRKVEGLIKSLVPIYNNYYSFVFNFTALKKKQKMTDLFQHPDYYQLDELLSEEHKMIRDATREWVKRSVSPIIED